MKALVWGEHEDGVLKDATLSAVTAALKLGEVDLLVAGSDVGSAAEAASRVAGVSRVLVVDDPGLAHAPPDAVEAVVVALMPGYGAFLAAATSEGKAIAPRVAARLDVMQVSEALSVEDDRTFTRPIYAGAAVATVRSTDPVLVLTVRATAFAKASREGGSAEVVSSPAGASETRSRFIGADVSRSTRPDLGAAKVIVSGGRALQSQDSFRALLEPLADKLGAAIGASRAAVDAGYASNDLQIGQTGKIVAPELYLAIGISGAIQHLAGMKDAKTIIAINRDPEAPIFQSADIGLVGDLFQILPELTAKL